MTQTDEFATVLSENLEGVSYDSKTQKGTAYVPNVGSIEFRSPSNEPGVIINLVRTKRFKATSPESAIEFIEHISEAWGNSD